MSTKDFSSAQENLIAKYLGWKVVAGSGAAACYPGDVKSDEFLGECKTHLKPGHKLVLNRNVWKKICQEAEITHRLPVLFIDDGSQTIENTWCIVRKPCFHFNLDRIVTVPTKQCASFTLDPAVLKDNFLDSCRSKALDYIIYRIKIAEDILYMMPLEVFKNVLEEQL